MSAGATTYQRFAEGRIGLRLLQSGPGFGRILFFPHAGSQSLAFRPLAQELAKSWSSLGIDPPGHGWSAGPPLDDVWQMAEEYVRHLPAQSFENTVLFGHSLGGLVAFAVTRLLQDQGRDVAGLILSGSRPPHRRDDYLSFNALNDRQLLEMLIRIGGVPASWGDEPEVFDYFKESLRADFRAFDCFSIDRPLVAVRTLALGGHEDLICRPEHILEWSRYCPGCQTAFVPGGHMFIQESPISVARHIESFLRDVLGG